MAANTDQAQLAFIVYDLRTGYAFYKPPPSGTLQSNLQSAPDPETAATMFETGYEGCNGVTGWMAVTVGSLCDDAKRRSFAHEALQQAHLGAGAGTDHHPHTTSTGPVAAERPRAPPARERRPRPAPPPR